MSRLLEEIHRAERLRRERERVRQEQAALQTSAQTASPFHHQGNGSNAEPGYGNGFGAGLNELLKSVERRLEKWKPQK